MTTTLIIVPQHEVQPYDHERRPYPEPGVLYALGEHTLAYEELTSPGVTMTLYVTQHEDRPLFVLIFRARLPGLEDIEVEQACFRPDRLKLTWPDELAEARTFAEDAALRLSRDALALHQLRNTYLRYVAMRFVSVN